MHGDKLDELDYKILSALQQDGRLAVARIGRAVGLSETPVANRIEKMEQSGVIKGYTALLERTKTKYPVMVILMVKLQDPNTGLFNQFQEMVLQLPEVETCYLVSGNWNFMLHVNATTPQAYATWLLDQILSKDYIANIESAYLMREAVRFKGFPL